MGWQCRRCPVPEFKNRWGTGGIYAVRRSLMPVIEGIKPYKVDTIKRRVNDCAMHKPHKNHNRKRAD